MKRKGTTIIELLVAITIVTVGLFAVIRMIGVVSSNARALTHRNEAKLIAKTHIDLIEARAQSDFDGISQVNWRYENDNQIYQDMGIELSKIYFVQEEVEYVVMEQDLSGTEDKPYRVRPIIDLDNNLADDYTGQGLDMKRVTVRVSWPETRRFVSMTAALNALLSGDENFFEEVRMRDYSLSTVVSSFQPNDQSCCSNPGIDKIELIAEDGGAIDWSAGAIPVSQGFTVRVGLNDNCPSRLPSLTLYYWYFGETIADAKELELQSAGSLNYYAVDVPGSEVKNVDVISAYASDSTCSEDYPGAEPFDMFLQVYVKDEFVGENCANSVRESFSETATINVFDREPPAILDYSSKIVADACDGYVMATIMDGSNGVAGLDLNNVKAYYSHLDPAGNKESLVEIVDRTGPDDQGRFMWRIPEAEISDWTGLATGVTYDNLPDLYYEIVAYDLCNTFARVPVDPASEETFITVSENDISTPTVILGYEGKGFTDCVPFREKPILVNYDVLDECGVRNTMFYHIPWQTLIDGGDYTPYYHYIDVYSNWSNITWEIWPDTRDDMYFRTYTWDESSNYTYNPPNKFYPSTYYHRITQSNAIYFPNAPQDPYISNDVELEGGMNDTVVLTLENFRNGYAVIDRIEIKDPTYKSICMSSGDTSAAFPYIDRITMEIDPFSTYYTARRGVIWDWNTDNPSPGSRERAPIELDLSKANFYDRYITDKGSIVKLYLHFVNQPTDQPVTAMPFPMDQCDFDIILKMDQNYAYKCPQEYVFSTKDFSYNYPPVANAGADNFGTVGNPIYFDARGSGDCDNLLGDLSFYWDMGNGMSMSGATFYYTYTENDFLIAKGGAADSEPAYIDVTLEATDPVGDYDTDVMTIILFPPVINDVEICNDNVDNDGDGFIDCEDTDCVDFAGCNTVETICNDGLDNDGDGLVDCDDGDCASAANCMTAGEICDNGIDDDGDGAVDCDDTDCAGYYLCQTSETNCNDGIDNDGDGNIDCADGDCASDPSCQNLNKAPQITSVECTVMSGTVIGFVVYVDDPDDSTLHYTFDWGDNKVDSFNAGLTASTSHPFADNKTQSFTVTITVNDAAGSDVAYATVSCVKKSGCTCGN